MVYSVKIDRRLTVCVFEPCKRDGVREERKGDGRLEKATRSERE